MAQRVSRGGMGMRTRKKTFVPKAPSVVVTIDDATTAVLTMQYESIMIVSDTDNSKWWII